MHNIKDIRENFNQFKKNLLKRNIQINFEEIINLDKNNRKLIQKKETLEKEKSNHTVKGEFIRNIFITSSMGVSYKIKLGKNI